MTSLTIYMGAAPLVGYYIAPTGSDTTGDGTIGKPWATLQKFIDASPAAGSTLYCRGGTYTSTAIVWAGGSGHPALAGTAGNVITMCSYPGETPVFHGQLALDDGNTYVTVDGLQWVYATANSGTILLGDGANGSYSTHHITIQNCKITHSGTFPDALEHAIYVNAYCSDITIQYNELVGPGAGNNGGWGVHQYHTPGALNLVVQHNIIRNWQNASGGGCTVSTGTTGSILHNTFIDCANNIVLYGYSSLTVRDNAGEDAIRGTSYNLVDVPGTATKDHNFWGQAFDANYYLLAGQTGRGAASDGTDAGALDW